MADTCWDKIGLLEEMVAGQNADPLVEFVRILATKGLLTKDAFHFLCEGGLGDRVARWECLHEFAEGYIKHDN